LTRHRLTDDGLRHCGELFLLHPDDMSVPLSRKNLPESPFADDILNAFGDYLTATGTEPYDHQEEAIIESGVRVRGPSLDFNVNSC
jgi:hypothetical protein